MAIKQKYKRNTYDKIKTINELVIRIEGKRYFINGSLDYCIEILEKIVNEKEGESNE